MLRKEVVVTGPRQKPRVDRHGPVTGTREGKGFVVAYTMRDGKMTCEVKGRAKLQDLTRVLHQLERKWCVKNGLVNDDQPTLTHTPFGGIKELVASATGNVTPSERVGEIDCNGGITPALIADALRVGVEKGRSAPQRRSRPGRKAKPPRAKPPRAKVEAAAREVKARATRAPEEEVMDEGLVALFQGMW